MTTDEKIMDNLKKYFQKMKDLASDRKADTLTANIHVDDLNREIRNLNKQVKALDDRNFALATKVTRLELERKRLSQ